MRTASLSARRPSGATFEGGAVIGFEHGEADLEELALWDNDDVEAWRDVIVTEDLSYQTFSAISVNRTAELFRGGNPEPPRR